MTVVSDPDLDGVVDTSGFLTFRPEVCFSYTGDLESSHRPGYQGRQLYAFSLAAVPPGARILGAALRLNQARVDGDPYGKNGNVVVDRMAYVGVAGPDSYDGQDVERDIGTLSSDATLEVKTLDVTNAVRSDLESGRIWSQFRLRFYREWHLPILDRANDFVRFTDAEGGAGGPLPTLVVHYQP